MLCSILVLELEPQTPKINFYVVELEDVAITTTTIWSLTGKPSKNKPSKRAISKKFPVS